MARVGHVRIDSTVSPVCPSALLRGLVNLNVGDDEFLAVKAFRFGVGFGVLEEAEDEFGRLLWPATERGTELLGLGGSSSAAVESPHWDTLLLLPDILEVDKGTSKLHAADSLSSLASVFERNTEVRTARLGGLVGVLGNGGVADHFVGDGGCRKEDRGMRVEVCRM